MTHLVNVSLQLKAFDTMAHIGGVVALPGYVAQLVLRLPWIPCNFLTKPDISNLFSVFIMWNNMVIYTVIRIFQNHTPL